MSETKSPVPFHNLSDQKLFDILAEMCKLHNIEGSAHGFSIYRAVLEEKSRYKAWKKMMDNEGKEEKK